MAYPQRAVIHETSDMKSQEQDSILCLFYMTVSFCFVLFVAVLFWQILWQKLLYGQKGLEDTGLKMPSAQTVRSLTSTQVVLNPYLTFLPLSFPVYVQIFLSKSVHVQGRIMEETLTYSKTWQLSLHSSIHPLIFRLHS